jgi:hypothetical protein
LLHFEINQSLLRAWKGSVIKFGVCKMIIFHYNCSSFLNFLLYETGITDQ